MQQRRQHTLRSFDERLEKIRGIVLTMASLVSQQYHLLSRALVEREENFRSQIVKNDIQVDGYELDLDERVVSFLATHSPMASDLRLVLATTKTARELERAGDEAVNGTRRLYSIPSDRLAEVDQALARVCAIVAEQMDHACVALTSLDAEGAQVVVQRDRQINSEVKRLRRRTFELSTELDVVLPYVALGRAIERGGDHAKVIGRLAVGAATGVENRHPKARKRILEGRNR